MGEAAVTAGRHYDQTKYYATGPLPDKPPPGFLEAMRPIIGEMFSDEQLEEIARKHLAECSGCDACRDAGA